MFNPFKAVIKRSRMLISNGWSPFFSASNGQVVSVGPVNASAALNNSDVFAVVYRISSDVAACQFEAPMVDYMLNHPMGTLINGYNVWQSVVAQMALNGNAYMLIHREGTDGVVTRLEPIPEERVTVTLNDDGSDVSTRSILTTPTALATIRCHRRTCCTSGCSSTARASRSTWVSVR